MYVFLPTPLPMPLYVHRSKFCVRVFGFSQRSCASEEAQNLVVKSTLKELLIYFFYMRIRSELNLVKDSLLPIWSIFQNDRLIY